MTKNICLIGAGRIGSIHAFNICSLEGVTLKYIVDPFEDAAANLGGKTGASVASLEDALSDDDLAGVVIASATNTHADFIEKAAEAGKAIFCEKPIDLDLGRTKSAIATAERNGVSLLLGFNRRFDPDFANLKQVLDSGTLGATEMIHITSRDPSPPPVSYINTSGGLFKDMMIHDLDMARWLLGEEPTEVTAQASCLIDPAIAEAGDVDSALVTLRTSSGKLCQISNSRRAVYGYDQRIEVHCSGGKIQADNRLESSVRVNLGEGDQQDKMLHFFLERYANAYKNEAVHFAYILNGRAAPRASGTDGLQALVLAEAALRSYQTGATVKL